MAAAAAAEEHFWDMAEAELREWVEANPGRVNDRDRGGSPPLFVAVYCLHSLSLTVWLLDEKGADVNCRTNARSTPLHKVQSLDVLTALMDHGADPTLLDGDGRSPLMIQVRCGRVDNVLCLLQDPRVQATVDTQSFFRRDTALHVVRYQNKTKAHAMVQLLLQGGANPTVANKKGEIPLAFLCEQHPTHHITIALLEGALANAETSSLLVKARRLVVAARSNIVAPFCLQQRVQRRRPLPRVVLTPVESDEEDGRKFRTMLSFLLGMGGGPEGDGMPRDVFRVVLDLLMPFWDPLRHGVAGDGGQLQLG